MTITPIDASKVMEALRNLLEIATLDLQVRCTRGEEINQDPALAPWIGVYPVGEDYASRTLGMGSGFRMQEISLAVVIQQTSNQSGAKCQDLVEQLKQIVIGAILTDTSLGGTVQVVEKFTVQYATVAKQSGQPAFQSAVIYFTGLVPVNAS